MCNNKVVWIRSKKKKLSAYFITFIYLTIIYLFWHVLIIILKYFSLMKGVVPEDIRSDGSLC